MIAWRQNLLGNRQLVIAEADELERTLRESLGIVVETRHWELLRRGLPAAEASLLALHERLSRRIFSHPTNPSLQIALSPEEEAPLGQMLQLLSPLPPPGPLGWQAKGPPGPAGRRWIPNSCSGHCTASPLNHSR